MLIQMYLGLVSIEYRFSFNFIELAELKSAKIDF